MLRFTFGCNLVETSRYLLQVPALEHNGKIIGESLDLIKYLDNTFEGPSLYPEVTPYHLGYCFPSFPYLFSDITIHCPL